MIRLGRTHLRRLWSFQAQFQNPRAARPLTPAALKDLLWWRDLLVQFNGILILNETQRRSIHLFTNASAIGQGGFWYEASPDHIDWRKELPHLQEQAVSDGWLPHQKKKVASINTRGFITVTTAISTWAQAWRGAHLTIYVDNNVA